MKTKKHIRILFLICLTLIIAKPSFSQITIDVGKDTTYCAGLYPDTMYLGTNLNIDNGAESYSYRWECKVELSPTLIFTANDFLNDTTTATPHFKDWITGIEKIKFFVHVTDSLGNYAKDSINVRFSVCGCPTGTIVVEINKGDSVWLDAGDSYDKYEKFFWKPEYGLTHPDNSATWCKPEVNTSYSLVMIDTFGCSCICPIYEIRILPTGVDELNFDRNNILNIRQEGTKIYFYNPLNQEAHIAIYSTSGRIIYNSSTSADNIETNDIIELKGVYIIRITVAKITDSSKFIK